MSASEAPGAVAVEAEGLVKRFGDFTAVNNVSFRVARGEIFGFLGSNGAGKSTVIRMLCGLLTPTAGQARVGGFDLATQSALIRENIGYMSQRFSLYDDLTVEENITFFSGVYGVTGASREERKRMVLGLADLEERRAALTRDLPGGWKQRLALGCAIVHAPPILFLDEPTSGVDPIARRGFWDLIYRLAGEGHTIFVTTHYMDEAEYCHRLALMHRGSLIATGTPAAIKGLHTGPGLLALECSDLLGAIETLEGAPGVVETAVFGRGLHITVTDPAIAEPEIRRRLARRGIAIERLEPRAAGIEDVFVSLVEQEDRRAS